MQYVVQAGGSVTFWGCFNFMEKGSLVEITVNLNHSAHIELTDNQVLPFAHHLTEEHNIPIPVFRDDSSRIHRAANDAHSVRTSRLARKSPRFEIS